MSFIPFHYTHLKRLKNVCKCSNGVYSRKVKYIKKRCDHVIQHAYAQSQQYERNGNIDGTIQGDVRCCKHVLCSTLIIDNNRAIKQLSFVCYCFSSSSALRYTKKRLSSHSTSVVLYNINTDVASHLYLYVYVQYIYKACDFSM